MRYLEDVSTDDLIVFSLFTAIAVILVVVAVGVRQGTREFKEVCAQTGGVAVFDGRQYECLKETSK